MTAEEHLSIIGTRRLAHLANLIGQKTLVLSGMDSVVKKSDSFIAFINRHKVLRSSYRHDETQEHLYHEMVTNLYYRQEFKER